MTKSEDSRIFVYDSPSLSSQTLGSSALASLGAIASMLKRDGMSFLILAQSEREA
jgi:hypothetical protein